MKTWVEAGLKELNIEETAQELFGNSYDGGYIGDHHVGVLEWNCGGGSGDDEGSDSSNSGVNSLS